MGLVFYGRKKNWRKLMGNKVNDKEKAHDLKWEVQKKIGENQ